MIARMHVRSRSCGTDIAAHSSHLAILPLMKNTHAAGTQANPTNGITSLCGRNSSVPEAYGYAKVCARSRSWLAFRRNFRGSKRLPFVGGFYSFPEGPSTRLQRQDLIANTTTYESYTAGYR